MSDPKFDTYLGHGPKRIQHWEAWSCPDAETYLTGIDYYEHPRLCRIKFNELYPLLNLPIPDRDDPRPKPHYDEARTSDPLAHTIRWGDGDSGTFQHGEAYFHSPEDVYAFSPLKKGDFTDWAHVVMNLDFSSEEVIYQRLRKDYPAEWGDRAPEGSAAEVGFYNTTFMWPLLCFGWELFMECALDPRFKHVMEEFAEINRRVFRAFARLPVNFVTCHDDITMTKGPICSPKWMHQYVFPRYEEYWGIVKETGKGVIFMSDGCLDAYADDVMACGALGMITEPYTDFKAIARKHKNCFLAGEGDNRILMRNNPDEINDMVLKMVDTGRMTGGYMMGIGNHIPWNVPPEAIKRYLDLSNELAYR